MLISLKISIFTSDMLWESCPFFYSLQLSHSIAVPKTYSFSDNWQLNNFLNKCIKNVSFWCKVTKKWFLSGWYIVSQTNRPTCLPTVNDCKWNFQIQFLTSFQDIYAVMVLFQFENWRFLIVLRLGYLFEYEISI